MHYQRKTAKELGLKIGDQFRVNNCDEGDSLDGTKVGDVIYLSEDDNTHCPYFKHVNNKACEIGPDCLHCLYFDQLEPYNVTNAINKGDNNMSVSPQEIKNLKLSDSDRLLFEAGFTTTDGSRTQDYTEVLLDKLAAQYKEEVVADLKTINEAKKANK